MADRRNTFLVVDEPEDRDPILRGLLGVAPGRVWKEAESMDEAVGIVERWRDMLLRGGHESPDLVLVDPDHHRVDALALVRLIRERIDHKVAIVVFSRTVRDELIRDVLRLGASAVVRKPEAPDAIEERAAAIARYWLLLNTPCPQRAVSVELRG